MIDQSPSAAQRLRAPSIRTLLVILAIGALAYVAAIGAHLAMRFRPAIAAILRDSDALAERLVENRRRAEHHDAVIRALWTQWRAAQRGAVPLDTLEALRLSLQQFAVASHRSGATTAPTTAPAELVSAMERAEAQERELRNALLGALAALQVRDTLAASRLLARADSLNLPLARALSEGTDISLREVQRQERELFSTTREATRILLLWVVLGMATVPVVGLLLRRWIYRPLATLDDGLDRLSAGTLDVRLPGEGADEIARLQQHFNVVAQNLRERAAASEARMALETAERTRRIMDAALDAVVVIDEGGLVREWNPQAEAVFGWSRGEMLGVHLTSLLFPKDTAEASGSRLVEDAVNMREPALGPARRRRVRTSARRRDGGLVSIEIGVMPLGGDARIEYAIFIRDLSTQEAAETALVESETRYRAAFEQSTVGMAEVDPMGRMLRVNPAAAGIIGRPAEQLVGVPFSDLLSPDQSTEDADAFTRLVRGELPMIHTLRSNRRSDGSAVWIDLTAAPVRDADGRVAYVFATAQDVSERVRLEGELRQAQKMEAVGQLAGGVAHDFNNILAGIMGFADLLQHEAGATEAVRGEARAIVATAQRGADLAQKLLSLSREAPTLLADIDVHDVISEVDAIIRRAFDRTVEIRMDLDERPAEVRADRTQVSNALLNLALNARDAMPGGGRITFRTRRVRLDAAFCARFAGAPVPGAYVAISVSDTGAGMSEEVRSRIFEPFFTTKEHGKGTGLGLAMVYGSVRAHDGIIEVESRPGAGSTFTLYLPAREVTAARRITPQRSPLIAGEGHVLLADDETTVREVAARMLRRLGYTVDAVADGEQALARFRNAPDQYAFVVLDGDMPRMAGREAARAIRELRPHAIIFLATGYRAQQLGEPEIPEGFTAVLPKPYTLAELSRVIAAHLSGVS